MDTGRAVDDWEVRANAQVGGAIGAGGGFFSFTFYSVTLGGEENVTFTGLGRGFGGSGGGASIPSMSGSEEERRMAGRVHGSTSPSTAGFTGIHCYKNFSLDDLHWSMGKVSSAGAGLVVGVSLIEIEGGVPFDPLFKSGSGIGISVGVGMSVFEFAGFWVVQY